MTNTRDFLRRADPESDPAWREMAAAGDTVSGSVVRDRQTDPRSEHSGKGSWMSARSAARHRWVRLGRRAAETAPLVMVPRATVDHDA